MKVMICGGNSPVVQALRTECEARGMTVCAPERDPSLPEDAEAVVCAPDLTKPEEAQRLKALCGKADGRRLLIVGGPGSLYRDGSRTMRAAGSAPEELEALEALSAKGVDWSWFSCPEQMEPGEAVGAILGRDIRLLGPTGESRLRYADCAAALADELVSPRFCGKQFTAVSDLSAEVRSSARNHVDITRKYLFTRRGSYFGISSDLATPGAGLAYQSARLRLASRRGSPNPDNDLLFLTPLYDGREVGFAVSATPTELTLTTAYGRVTACFAEDCLLYLRGENGLGVRLFHRLRPGDQVKPRRKGAWECVMRTRCTLTLNPLRGSILMEAPWDGRAQQTPFCRADALAPEDGELLLAVEESAFAGRVREQYPTYPEALADVTRDWEEFLAHIPETDEKYADTRIEAAWNLWAFLANPSGLLRRTGIFMATSSIGSSWQLGHNAMALRDNLPIAAELMLNYIDETGDNLQIADFTDDNRQLAQCIHPPTQGVALQWLMLRHDLKTELPRETLEKLYTGYSRWRRWFDLARDEDGDGLAEYDDAIECGFDDASIFCGHKAVETPDLSAYLVVLDDALAALAEALDRPEEAEKWRRAADDLTALLLRELWNGERFVARTDRSHEIIATDSLMYYLPIVLGKRLPRNIIDRLTADLMREGEFLTENGLATEKCGSDHFGFFGLARGWVIPPSSLLITVGLYLAGKTAEAKELARRYCDACEAWHIPMLIDPVRGVPNGFACSWPACTFLVLADLLHNM